MDFNWFCCPLVAKSKHEYLRLDCCKLILSLWFEQVAKYFMKLAGERDNLFVETLPDVGHCPHDDRPELAAGRIHHFLSAFDL